MAEIINEGLYCKELIEGLGRRVGIMKGGDEGPEKKKKGTSGWEEGSNEV